MPISNRKRSRRSRRRPEPLLSRDASSMFTTALNSDQQATTPTSPDEQATTPTSPDAILINTADQDEAMSTAALIQPQTTVADTHSTITQAQLPAAPRPTTVDDDDAHNPTDNLALHLSPPKSDLAQKAPFNDDCNVQPTLPPTPSDDDDSEESLFSDYLHNPIFSLFEHCDDEVEEAELGQQHLLQDILTEESRQRTQTQLSSNVSEQVQRAQDLLHSLRKLMSRSLFLGIVSLYGKTRYTLDHYDHLVAMMQDGPNGVLLPCATTMRKYIFPRLIKSLFVKSSIESFPTKSTFISYVPKSPKLAKKQTEAAVVLPSSWMTIDISSLHVLRELVCIKECRCRRTFGSNDLRVDSSSHVTNRIENSQHADTLWINRDGVPTASSPGMTIRLHTSVDQDLISDQCPARDFEWKKVKFRGEVCTAFHVEIVSTVHVRYSRDRGVYLEHGIQPHLSNDAVSASYHSNLSTIKRLCRSHHNVPCSTGNNNPAPNSRESAQTRRELYRRKSTSLNRMTDSSPYLIPSDHLTIVRYGSDGSIGVLVSRFWVDRLEDERNFFIALNSDEEGHTACTSIPIFAAPVFVREGPKCVTSSNPERTCKTTGRLSNGMRFYVYRVILYADDFNPRSSLFPKGSVGGVYMNPSSFHVRSRRSQLTIRTISVTPAGVSTNSVISFIIDDMVKGCTDGFVCFDAFGERVTVFLDILGFVGDYPASTAVVDLKGHNALSPCTVCGFTINNSPWLTTYAFTTSITSRHSAYRRTQQRSLSLREVGLTADQGKVLGMSSLKIDEVTNTDQCPLIRFACKHNEQMKDSDVAPGLPSCKKDGYALNLIAPDHMFTGLFKGLITIVFLQLPNELARDKVQISLKASLSDFGFQSQNVLFKHKKKKLVPGLSMSMLYAIMAVLPSTLQAQNLLDNLPSKHMLLNLQRLCGIAFWWPHLNQDGIQAWNFVHGSHMKLFHRSLQILASNFVKSVQVFSESYFELAKHVDKPNIHRLLELVQQTIPLFNHIGYFCELVFESAHQPLKYFLSRNHSLNSHIHSVQLILAKDWMVRLWSLWRIHFDEQESSDSRHHALIGIFRLLLGGDIDSIDWTSEGVSQTLTEMRDHVHYLMKGTVHRRFYKWYHDSQMSFEAEAAWVFQSPPKNYSFPDTQRSFLRKSVTQLAKLCLEKECNFTLGYKALLHRGFGSSAKSSHEQLGISDVVQVLLRPGFKSKKFLTSYVSNKGTPHFFVVGGFIKGKSGVSWVVVHQCTLVSPKSVGQLPDLRVSPMIQVRTKKFYDLDRLPDYQYLRLSSNVRKVGVLHNCSKKGRCVFSFDTRQVEHSCTPLDDGHFFILSRSMGYPPRRS